MKESKYLERFKGMPEEDMSLIGDYLLVEKIELEERKTTGGLIVNHHQIANYKNTTIMDLPVFVYIVAVGKGYYDEETNEPVDLTVSAGDICLVGSSSVRWFSDMEINDYQSYELGLTREAEIKLVFKGKKGYEKAMQQLNNKPVKTEVPTEGGNQ